MNMQSIHPVQFHNPSISGTHDHDEWQLTATHTQPLCSTSLCLSVELPLNGNERISGDGFQMLSQTAGSTSQPHDVGRCPDNNAEYRLYPEYARKRYYNYLVIEHSDHFSLFGFTSCHRFAGYFEIELSEGNSKVHAFIDGESVQVNAGDELETLVLLRGPNLAALYDAFSSHIAANHPPRAHVKASAPIGWCSWYAYYADVNEQNIRQNLAQMDAISPDMEWLLLDDGYQAFMGDWLVPSERFTNGVKSLIADIKAQGKRPAIWLAPFIAQKESHLFQTHPDWFVTNEHGEPLKAEDITYSGWRCTPWYMLDFANPEVCEHITSVLRVMRNEWGVELFKLDANYWGALKGKRSQPNVTGVEAYRMGMEAIAKGIGNGWILGCNAPMWPSLGLVDAMRVSDDVERHTHRYQQIAKESFYRSWQHRRLWQLDPDCIALTPLAGQHVEERNFIFHRDALFASGGVMLSGDPLPELSEFAKTALPALFARQGMASEAAQFNDLSLSHAVLQLNDGRTAHCLFNLYTDSQTIELTAHHPVMWRDYWSNQPLCNAPTQTLSMHLANWLDSRIIIASPV